MHQEVLFCVLLRPGVCSPSSFTKAPHTRPQGTWAPMLWERDYACFLGSIHGTTSGNWKAGSAQPGLGGMCSGCPCQALREVGGILKWEQAGSCKPIRDRNHPGSSNWERLVCPRH